MGELAVIVPSRGRPHNIARLLDAMSQTCQGGTDLIVGADDNDPYLDEYQAFTGCQVVVKPGLQGRLVEWLNVLAIAAANDYPYVGHIGDDNIPRSDGWDVKIIDSLRRQGPIGFCFGDDLDPGRTPGTLSIHIFMTSNVIRRLGYMGPPSIQHMYVDPVWYAWGTATSIEFLPDAVLEHMHYSLSRSPMDESYQHSTGLIPSDCTNYNDYCDDPEGLNADIVKLGGVPFTAEAMAVFNQRLNIPHRWAA
jgi:hypothetical protein